MNQNNFWRFVLVVLVVAWAFLEVYPPKGRDMVQVFRETAVKHDPVFNAIVAKAQALQKERPDRGYDNLVEAVGTNDLTLYFPQFEAKNESHPNTYILNRVQRKAAGRIRLGLDLQGGTSFLVSMDTSTLTNASEAEISTALSQAIEVLRKRVDFFGVAEPLIVPQGKEKILVQLPGLSAAEQENAMLAIKKPAYLEFRLVHEKSSELIAQGLSAPGYELMTHIKTTPSGVKQVEKHLVKKKPEMVGGIKSANVIRDTIGRPVITFSLDSAATDLFGRITKENIGRLLAVVLDGELQTAPVIRGEIAGGNGEIEGDYSEQEAFALRAVLENPLKTPLKLEASRTVDPTLGRDAIHSGINASVYGTLAVSAFMLVYYMTAGLVANVALMANIVLLVGAMCLFNTTFTLPGIAGLVLTVGMAVDANVLIYERIREESAKGKSLRGAIAAGYARAFGTIFDSHVTTLISSVILWKMGTGSIQGFGIALTIGVLASLFTALVVTRMIFDFTLERGRTHVALALLETAAFLWIFWNGVLKLTFDQGAAVMALAVLASLAAMYGVAFALHKLLDAAIKRGLIPVWRLEKVSMLHIIRAAKLDFMKLAKPAFVTSWLIIAVGVGWGVHRGKSAFGRDFIGGDSTSFSFTQKLPTEQIRAGLEKANVKDPRIQYQKDTGSGRETLRVDSLPGTGQTVVNAVTQVGAGNFSLAGQDTVGPSVGKDIQQSAIIASLLSLFGILVYVAFRYEFSFAVGAVLAVIHDVLMTIGIYYLSGREFSATTVAAILTIIGFSTNDTIVIFDRIREDLRLGIRGTFKEVMNQALNQTLSRTIITSGTVFLATLSLFIFGGGEINDFAFTFLVGIITGTYSSIYIASALVLWWHKGQRPAIGGAPVAAEPVAAPARR
jgi:SecD/SecF fusion protein